MSAFAAGSVTGVWHGKVKYDSTKLPATLSADQKKNLTKEANRRELDVLTLTLNPNHTFKIVVTGADKQPPPVTGKWSQSANTIAMQPVKDGKADMPRTFTLSKDGKSMSFTYGPVTMHFKR